MSSTAEGRVRARRDVAARTGAVRAGHGCPLRETGLRSARRPGGGSGRRIDPGLDRRKLRPADHPPRSAARPGRRQAAAGPPAVGGRALDGGQPKGEEGVVAYTMTCHSGGSLEVYVEPFAPPSRLVVVGDSPVRGPSDRSSAHCWALIHRHTRIGTLELAAGAAIDTWLAIASMGDGDSYRGRSCAPRGGRLRRLRGQSAARGERGRLPHGRGLSPGP